MRNLALRICGVFIICNLAAGVLQSFAQQAGELEFSLDANSSTIPLPKIFKPNIDLSGRGFHRQATWPQGIAAGEVLSHAGAGHKRIQIKF